MDSNTLIIGLAIVALAMAVGTLFVAQRDGYRRVPVRRDYDTRRPNPRD